MAKQEEMELDEEGDDSFQANGEILYLIRLVDEG